MRRSPSFRKVSRIGVSTRSPSTDSWASAARWPCAWQKSHGGAAGEVVAREAFDQVGQQRAFARLVPAEEMGAAAHVEQKSGIAAEAAGAAGFRPFFGDGAAQRIDRHPGRVAVAPIGDRFDQAAVGLRFAGRRDQVGHQGAGIGQAHMGAQAGGAGMGVDRDETRAAVAPDDGGGSPSRPVARRSRESIRGKLGEPQRDNVLHRSTPRARMGSRRRRARRSGCV